MYNVTDRSLEGKACNSLVGLTMSLMCKVTSVLFVLFALSFLQWMVANPACLLVA